MQKNTCITGKKGKMAQIGFIIKVNLDQKMRVLVTALPSTSCVICNKQAP